MVDPPVFLSLWDMPIWGHKWYGRSTVVKHQSGGSLLIPPYHHVAVAYIVVLLHPEIWHWTQTNGQLVLNFEDCSLESMCSNFGQLFGYSPGRHYQTWTVGFPAPKPSFVSFVILLICYSNSPSFKNQRGISPGCSKEHLDCINFSHEMTMLGPLHHHGSLRLRQYKRKTAKKWELQAVLFVTKPSCAFAEQFLYLFTSQFSRWVGNRNCPICC